MDKNDPCSEVLSIENATLLPAAPAALATIQLHYERRVCVKLLGKEHNKTLVGGDAEVQVRLTPQIAEDGTGLRLAVELGDIRATGSLGDLLRSGPLGATIREKIRTSILGALQKGTDLSATLPHAVQGYASIAQAQFQDGGNGRLLVVLSGEVRLTQQQVQELAGEMKQRLAGR